jgi:hypothetical protein
MADLHADFPNLQSGVWQTTSPPDKSYNCIAFAAGRTDVFWWPDDYPDPDFDHWPHGVLREETVAAFVQLYESLGFESCVMASWKRGSRKSRSTPSINRPRMPLDNFGMGPGRAS